MFTETWYSVKVSPVLHPNYTCLHIDRATKRESGVTIYHKSALPMTVIENCSVITADVECLVVNAPWHFVVLYRHPSGNFEKFSSYLESMLTYTLHKNTKIIMGDINIDLLCDTINQQLYNLIRSYGCTSFIGIPARVTPQSNTLVDVCTTDVNPLNTVPGVFL